MGAAGSIAEIKSVQFFNNRPGGVAISRPSLSTCQVSVSPCITNPKNGATPASAYVALSGVGTRGAAVANPKDGSLWLRLWLRQARQSALLAANKRPMPVMEQGPSSI